MSGSGALSPRFSRQGWTRVPGAARRSGEGGGAGVRPRASGRLFPHCLLCLGASSRALLQPWGSRRALPAPWCRAFGCRGWDASTGQASEVLGGLHRGEFVLGVSLLAGCAASVGGLAEAANPPGTSPPSGPDASGWHCCRQQLLFILNNFSVASYSVVAPQQQGHGKRGASCVVAGEPSRAAVIWAGLWHTASGAARDLLVTAAASCSCPGLAPWVGLLSPLALRTALV